MKKILYVGPSWAARSYETIEGSEPEYTNLARELKLDVINLSELGLSNNVCLDKVNKNLENCAGIIWIYCEPVTDTLHTLKKYLIESENFWDIRSKMNHNMLTQINKLGVPVALIGGHSDIVDCDFSNIEVIHKSWQKFLADSVNVQLDHGWGAEVAHRFATREFLDIKPSKSCVNYISDTLNSWTKMELNGVFCGCHPNRYGNKIFAQEIKNSINSFINNL